MVKLLMNDNKMECPMAGLHIELPHWARMAARPGLYGDHGSKRFNSRAFQMKK
jgi:hypothetical protein